MIAPAFKMIVRISVVATAILALSSAASFAQKRSVGMGQMQQMMQGGQIPSQYMQSIPPQYQQYVGGSPGSAGGAGAGNQVDFQSQYNNSGNPHQTTYGCIPGQC